MKVGALYQGDGVCTFRVFAPHAESLSVELIRRGESRPLQKRDQGYWEARVEGIRPGELYKYSRNGKEPRPDPASFFQPEGVHGPSQVWDHASFPWTDRAWQGASLDEY
ncbi:MAG TPA: malto-oligosyltrehalose trehalohydrolase, partial [Fibrobacteria bacterium]|nr:malto-oligosyltrehalose trehalohydrolase [Fibrobacteria bacterium]